MAPGRRVALGWGLLLAAISCGKDSEPKTCGTQMCTERQTCDTSSSPVRCVCRQEFTGTSCTACARGYILNASGNCVASEVKCSTPGVCGARGTCVSGGSLGGDSCMCVAGYGGVFCQTCADGYQDNDKNGTCTPTCGATTCPAPQSCSDSTGTARCACSGNKTGTNCDMCPAGWMLRASDNTCVQSCATSSTVCGTKKMCDATQGVCVCRPEYTGDLCDTCAPGYQDNDKNGTCSASCAMMTCSTGQSCTDTTGTARCACPPNRTGTNCEQCASGWVLRPSDNTCVQTCASVSSCGARRYCDESQGAPICVCQAGYSGADCSACATGYTADGAGACVRSAPAGTTLLGAARVDTGEYLVAIDPTAGTVTPLRQVAGVSGQRLASDVASHAIYTVTSTGINRLDAITGRLTPVATVQSLATLCYGGGALYTFGTISPYLLKRIDPSTGAVSDIGPSNLAASSGSTGLTWEKPGTLLYARPPATGATGAELYRVDAATAAVTMLGALPVEATRLRPADNRLGLAFDVTGKLFIATHLGRTPEDVVAEHCRKVAAGVGLVGYEAAPLTSIAIAYDGIGAGLTKTLTSRNASGKEIVAYASYGRRTAAKATMRIETTNPEAFVCASTYEEVIELSVSPATARFAGIGITGYRPILTLVVDGVVPPVTRPTLHVFTVSGTVAPAFNGASGGYQFSKVYTATEWNGLRLPTYASAWDSDAGAPSVLLEVDLATRTTTRTLYFPAVDLFPTLAPWAP
jgi:hypothetical protein